MVFEPRKKRRFLYIVVGTTFIEACFGLVILSTIHIISDCKIYNVNSSIQCIPDELVSLIKEITAGETNSTILKPSSDLLSIGDFKQFIQPIRRKCELYAGEKVYSAFFGIYIGLNILWIFTLIGLCVAAHNIPNNYKYLLPYITITIVISIVDTFSTFYFIAILGKAVVPSLQADGSFKDIHVILQLKFTNWDEFLSSLSWIFIPLFCSKLFIYWIINDFYLWKTRNCYKLFKEYYENPFDKKFRSSYELEKYSDDNQTEFDNTGYSENENNWIFHHPQQNGSIKDFSHNHMYQKSVSSHGSLNSHSNFSGLHAPPPKVIGEVRSKNDHYQKRSGNVNKPRQPNLENRRATGYYENNELPIKNPIKQVSQVRKEDDLELVIPVAAYKKMPEEKISIPRIQLRF